jgi:hypothetical protein
MQTCIIYAIRQTIAFTELLVLGFATIGIRPTLVGLGGQLLADAVTNLSTGRRATETGHAAT